MNDDLQYELKQVIIHIGSAHGGHYKTYIRDDMGEKPWNPPPLKEPLQPFPIPPSNPDLLQNWFEFNDSVVKPIYGETIAEQFGDGKNSSSAYILIYQ